MTARALRTNIGSVLLFAVLGCQQTPGAVSTLHAARDDTNAHTPRDDAFTPAITSDADTHASLSTDASSPDVIARVQIDPDGNDDPVHDTGTGTLAREMHFVRVGRPPKALKRICDLRPTAFGLYSTHAREPLGNDGATVGRYEPNATPAFTIAFDWNRPGEPDRGGGAGQGFMRARLIDGRLFVPDTDPPHAGFQISDNGTEGFVFVSDANGVFAPPRAPHFRPPAVPTPEGRAGASVLPRAYHVLDVIKYRGHLYASTGSVPPREHAWEGPSPGALHRADDTWRRWTFAAAYPFPWRGGVWRMTYMVRFRDRLYAGLQDYDFREPNDYVVIEPPAGSTEVNTELVRGVRVSEQGTAQTVRWYADNGTLYWIALERGARGVLRATDDGDHWRTIALPRDAGRPSDITRFRGSLVVLTETGLFQLEGDRATRIATSTRPTGRNARAPFEITNWICAAPLAVFRGSLYAGSQTDGSLYRVDDGPEPVPETLPPR